ncbi:MAG TPA: Uma2 family endonuclease [Urbifossiella sp.]|jgi:Uma2 family endonuclease
MIAAKKRFAEGITVQLESSAIEVPDRVRESLAAFRDWAGNNDLPEKTRVDFFQGKVWVDMGREQVFTHGVLKTKIAAVLTSEVDRRDLGFFSCNGVLVTNVAAELSGNPDGTFVSHGAIESGRVVLREGAEEGVIEIVGTPDMVLEVVSASSVKKDKVFLREAYWEAGIPEYWLVDARGDRIEFQILKHGAKGYSETRINGGWLRSNVFGQSFQLTRGLDRSGNPTFKLDVK